MQGALINPGRDLIKINNENVPRYSNDRGCINMNIFENKGDEIVQVSYLFSFL